ncbi:hypothetical protein HAX54_028026, partial [Datura stramonium]|nr:hypothetical protein [Datura stramonium]
MAERKRTFHSFETSDHHKLAGNPEKGMVPSTKRPKQQQSTCIAPTVTAAFSFSIIQLLCAVRYALITPLAPSKCADKHGGCSSGSEGFPQRHLPSLTTHEIVEC